MRGLFYNTPKSVCSIHETGNMCFNALKNSDLYTLEYRDVKVFDYTCDFFVVNQHDSIFNWINTNMLAKYKGISFCIVTEVGLYSDDYYPITPKFFDHYIILDPSIPETPKAHAFPRPLPLPSTINNQNTIPVIGSFGMSTPGKKWGKILEIVNKEFDEAIVRFNIPRGTHVPPRMFNDTVQHLSRLAKSVITKDGIKFELTTSVFTPDELIEWCANNTINVFLYERPHKTGLAAVTDQAIAAGRPILITSHPTFRHIHKYIDSYPNISIKDAMTQTLDGVLQMQKDWSSENFRKKFEGILGKKE